MSGWREVPVGEELEDGTADQVLDELVGAVEAPRRGDLVVRVEREDEHLAAHGRVVDVGGEVMPRGRLAAARGVSVCEGDLNDLLAYDDGSFDIVCSNQVIEHVRDTDQFVAETRRLLAAGGYTIASTEWTRVRGSSLEECS